MNNFFDESIEKTYLASLLINPKDTNRTIDLLKDDDFYNKNHQKIFWAIKELSHNNLKIDFNSIKNQLEKDPSKNISNINNVLAELIPWASFQENVLHFYKEIINYSRKRKVRAIFENWNKEIQPGNFDPSKILDSLGQELVEISVDSSESSFEDLKTLSDQAIKNMEKRATSKDINGISTGFPYLDKLTNGFQRGDLVILAARPSMGKTAFALNLATKISKKNYVAFFSYEMPNLQLVDRIFASDANIDGNKIKEPKNLTNEEWQKIYISKDRIKKLNLFFNDETNSKINDLIWKSRQLKKEKKLDVIIIDYLQLINTSDLNNNNRQLEVSYISRQLKLLATDLKITVIALSQLSRRVEQREDKMPVMSDLRESGSIEQDADIVSFLYREEYYKKNKDSEDEHDAKYVSANDFQKIELIIAKNRNGAIGTVDFWFKPAVGKFLGQKKEE